MGNIAMNDMPDWMRKIFPMFAKPGFISGVSLFEIFMPRIIRYANGIAIPYGITVAQMSMRSISGMVPNR